VREVVVEAEAEISADVVEEEVVVAVKVSTDSANVNSTVTVAVTKQVSSLLINEVEKVHTTGVTIKMKWRGN